MEAPISQSNSGGCVTQFIVLCFDDQAENPADRKVISSEEFFDREEAVEREHMLGLYLGPTQLLEFDIEFGPAADPDYFLGLTHEEIQPISPEEEAAFETRHEHDTARLARMFSPESALYP